MLVQIEWKTDAQTEHTVNANLFALSTKDPEIAPESSATTHWD